MDFQVNNYSGILFPYAYNVLGSVDAAVEAVEETIANHLSDLRPKATDERKCLIQAVVNVSIDKKQQRVRK